MVISEKLRTIINRSENEESDLCYAVEEYILLRKNQTVKINIHQFPKWNPFYMDIMETQYRLLDHAFYCAKQWISTKIREENETI